MVKPLSAWNSRITAPARLARLPSRLRLLAAVLLLACLSAGHQPAVAAPVPAPLVLTAGQAWRGAPEVSANGSRVVFDLRSAGERPGGVYLWETASGQLTELSRAPDGTSANRVSYQAVLSGDGRWAAFTSLADNLAAPDTNRSGDVFLVELDRARLNRISLGPGGREANGWSHSPSLSADGSLAVFASLAANLDPADADPLSDIYLYDRPTGAVECLSADDGLTPAAWFDQPKLTADGRYVFFTGRESAGPSGGDRLYRYDRNTRQTARYTLPWEASGQTQSGRIAAYTVSGNGDWVAALSILAGGGSESQLVVWTARAPWQPPGEILRASLPAGRAATGEVSLSYDGAWLALALTSPDPAAQIFQRTGVAWTKAAGQPAPAYARLAGEGAWMLLGEPAGGLRLAALPVNAAPGAFVSGWVRDRHGYPLGGVELRFAGGRITYTDSDGSFRSEGLSGPSQELTAAKKGYAISPASRALRPAVGSQMGLEFVAEPGEILTAARASLGMPYSLQRGCESPFKPCGGPFNGFFAGDCTDLILDAFRQGAELSLQTRLERDASANPQHYYRWQNTRNAHDMWRYFVYTGQMLPASARFLPGDIVFFDWSGDGGVDHVALISEVTRSERPRKLLDATGLIEENPSGLAIELDWKPYHASRLAGHARMMGRTAPPAGATPERLLTIGVDGRGVRLRVSTLTGQTLGDVQAGASLEQPGAPWPALPSSGWASLPNGVYGWLASPEKLAAQLLLEVEQPTPGFFELGVQLKSNGTLLDSVYFTGDEKTGAGLFLLRLEPLDGRLSFRLSRP